MVLGLDISTSFIGVTVMSPSGEILFTEALDLRKMEKCLFQKAEAFRVFLLQLIYKYDIKETYIEQSLQTFKSGFSSAQTLSTLAKFNGIISYIIYKNFKGTPKYISAASARKHAGCKISRGSNTKQKVLEFVLDKHTDFVVEYTKHGNPRPGTYDRCDSVIMCMAGLKVERETANSKKDSRILSA